MQKIWMVLMVVLLSVLTLSAEKQKGTLTLKDLQPAGTTDKNQKNQIYDFLFTVQDMSYTCRTNYETKIKATDYVVGDTLKFEIDGDNVKLKNAKGKEVKCKVVRVEKVAEQPR